MAIGDLIVWSSTYWDHGGYALMSRNYVKGLINRKWNVRIESIKSPKEISEEEFNFFSKLEKIKDGEPHIVGPYGSRHLAGPNVIRIVAHLPLINVPQTKHRIIYSMMECRDVHDFFIKRCNASYETLWTPTEYNKNVFIRNGLKIPCEIMPIAVDPIYKKENVINDLKLKYKVFGRNAPEFPEGFKFLSVFRWSFRKGFDLLLKSYLREFKNSDNVSLVIISRHCAMSHEERFNEAIEADIRREIDKYANPNSPPIYWCKENIPMDFMPSMYAIGDCFITCSRGEGFCLPALEAAQMGLPIIAPMHTGFLDYVNEDNSHAFHVDEWVNCCEVPEWVCYVTREFIEQYFPKFGDLTSDEVQSLMRDVKENYESAKIKNENLKKLIQEKYTLEKCVDKMESILEKI